MDNKTFIKAEVDNKGSVMITTSGEGFDVVLLACMAYVKALDARANDDVPEGRKLTLGKMLLDTIFQELKVKPTESTTIDLSALSHLS